MEKNKLSAQRIYFWIFIIILMIAALNFFLLENKGSRPSDELGNIALRLNLQAPKMLDSFTRFDSAKVLPGNKFQYNHTLLGLSKSMIDTNLLLTEGKRLFTIDLKNGYGFAYFKTNKIPIVHCFYDSAGDYVCGFQIEPNEYK